MTKQGKLYGITAVAVAIAIIVGLIGSVGGQRFGELGVFLCAVILSLVIQWIGFVPAIRNGSEKHYDLFGGIGFVGVTLAVLFMTANVGSLGWLLATMVIVWSLRLATFLFIRILKAGDDSRFNDIKNNPARFLLTWTLQALWVSFVASAAWIGITSEKQPGLTWVTWIGVAVWLIGLVFEITADVQKQLWRSRPGTRGQFINEGLWTISRHPNYFGEITLWVGVLIAASPAFVGWQWIAVISPIFTALLLTKISGIPLQQKSAEKKWGGDPDWEEYKRTTPVLVPLIGRKG